MSEQETQKYGVSVRVDYYYEIEATSREEAEKLGYYYEDYQHSGDVYSIKVEEVEDDCGCPVIHDPEEDCEDYKDA